MDISYRKNNNWNLIHIVTYNYPATKEEIEANIREEFPGEKIDIVEISVVLSSGAFITTVYFAVM
jgi:hypothetical protein